MVIIVLKLLLASIVFISILYYLFSLLCTMRFFREKPSGGDYMPSVTVLKPLNGEEQGIYENLLSHANQDYPAYQIVFGVHHDDDPVIPVVKRLMSEFPEKDMELVVSKELIGPNMKVCNLSNMYEKVKNEVVIINDSDTRVGTDYLRRIVHELRDADVGGATCVYKVKNPPGFVSAIEPFFVNCDFIPSALVAHALGMNFGFGATIAVRKKVLDEIGGFPPLADYIAEDYQMGERLAKAGYRLNVSNYIIDTALHKCGFWDQVSHLVRWVSTIRACRPKGYFLRIFTMGAPFSVLLMMVSNFSEFSIALFLLYWFTRCFTILIINIKYLEEKSELFHLLFLPLLDLIIFAIWCWGLFERKVTWGGHTFRLHEGGWVTRE